MVIAENDESNDDSGCIAGIHPNQVIEKIYESFSTDTGGKLHTVV